MEKIKNKNDTCSFLTEDNFSFIYKFINKVVDAVPSVQRDLAVLHRDVPVQR